MSSHPIQLESSLSKAVALLLPQAKTVADAALAFLAGFNRRTLDMIASRIYFYFSLAHERLDSLATIRRWDSNFLGMIRGSQSHCCSFVCPSLFYYRS
jgi:hypothetical protein